MIVRTFDPAIHNRIANESDVKPYLGEIDGDFDFTELCREPDNYCLLHNEEGTAATIWEWSAPGIWQAHSLFTEDCRGKSAIEVGRAMIEWMRINMNARMVWGQTPIDNKRARIFNRWCGLKSDGFGHHHISGDVEYFILRLERN